MNPDNRSSAKPDRWRAILPDKWRAINTFGSNSCLEIVYNSQTIYKICGSGKLQEELAFISTRIARHGVYSSEEESRLVVAEM